MKRVWWTAGCLALLVTITGCALSADERLKRYTDIDAAGTGVRVSVIERKDLDQAGYDLAIDNQRRAGFEHALQTVAGSDCVSALMNGSGCHFVSKAGHNVFVIKASASHYTVYTSG